MNVDLFSHMDWWPTLARLIGQPVPTREWKDNKGKSIIFDGIDLSESLLQKGPGKRNSMIYFAGQMFGGVRVKNFKFLYTAKDTWLGWDRTLRAPAIYDRIRANSTIWRSTALRRHMETKPLRAGIAAQTIAGQVSTPPL